MTAPAAVAERPVLTPAERAAVWREGGDRLVAHLRERAMQAVRLCAAGALTMDEAAGAIGAYQHARDAAKEG